MCCGSLKCPNPKCKVPNCLTPRVWQFRDKARKSVNSLLIRVQVTFFTCANRTVAALSLMPSSTVVFLFRNAGKSYFYKVACYSKHLPREWETTGFLLAVDFAFLTCEESAVPCCGAGSERMPSILP